MMTELPAEIIASAVALDVDGTLLTPERPVSPATIGAVRATRAKGIDVYLTTSRGPAGLLEVSTELGLGGTAFVSYQGALVGRFGDDGTLVTLTSRPIDAGAAVEIEGLCRSMGIGAARYDGVVVTTVHDTPVIDAAIRITGESPSRHGSCPAGPAPHKLMIVADPADPQPLRELAAALDPLPVDAVFSHDNFLEVTAVGVSKGTGLRDLAAATGTTLASTVAIGDGPNDLDMFEAVGTAIAMGQAPDLVIDAADYVTGSIDADGVAAVLERLQPPQATTTADADTRPAFREDR